LTQHDSITPLRIDEAVNIFDSMPNQLMSFEEAFNEILSKSNITTISDPIPQISSPHKFKYDVAISYSGSDKHVARELSVLLNNSGVRVFFDEDEPQLIWGQDLAVFFESVYRDESKYCIIIVSKEYIERTWTNHERQAAISRAIANRGERYVLQVKLDESVLPGIPSTISYMSFKDHSPEQIAGIVVKILNADS
jgi:hypothetical protein